MTTKTEREIFEEYKHSSFHSYKETECATCQALRTAIHEAWEAGKTDGVYLLEKGMGGKLEDTELYKRGYEAGKYDELCNCEKVRITTAQEIFGELKEMLAVIPEVDELELYRLSTLQSWVEKYEKDFGAKRTKSSKVK